MDKIKSLLHHLLIPNSSNNFRAKALHPDFLTGYLIFALLLTFTLKSLGGSFSNVLGFATDISTQKLFELTNTERTKAGLQTLTYNDKLAQAADAKAHDMFTKNYWAHYAPDGKSPWDFILGVNYKYEYAGENLAKNFLFSQGVVDAWMNSPSHRENILRPQYTEVGYAIVNGILNGEQTTLVVQMFGKPLAGQPVENAQVPQDSKPETIPAEPITQSAAPQVLAKQELPSGFSLPKLSFNLNVVFMVFLAIALIMDFYFAARSNIFRITGKHVAHLLFIGFLFLGLLFLMKGAII